MALFMNKQGQRSELQERIIQDLQEKAKNANGAGGDDTPKPEAPSIDDLKYLEGTKQTTTLAWAWLLIVLFAVIVVLMLVI